MVIHDNAAPSPKTDASQGLDVLYWGELIRPWKLCSFAVGMIWLLYGAINYQISDWDIGISLVMGSLTYFCAPWSVSVISDSVRHRSNGWFLRLLLAFIVAWAVVDGSYVGYHTALDNRMMRLENFRASSALYFLAGVLWAYRGSLRELMEDIKAVVGSPMP